jgi:hypothetical protein
MLLFLGFVTTAAVAQGGSLPVLLARVCANEDSRPLRPVKDGGTDGAPTADCLGIVQTARSFARWKGISVEAAIRRLSPHVTGTRAPKDLRHAAYGALPAQGADRPAPWDETRFGPWLVHGPRWVTLRGTVQQLLAKSSAALTPCNGDPVTWGCKTDEPIALARGLVRLDCGETRNSFWGLPPHRAIEARVIPASVAAGR